MTHDAAREEFLRGARLKIEGQRMMAQGQDAMERGAWMAVDAGERKVDIPTMLAGWVGDDQVHLLGISEHSVSRWLSPRNRERVLP